MDFVVVGGGKKKSKKEKKCTRVRATREELVALDNTDRSGVTSVKMCLRATTALILCSVKVQLGFFGTKMHWLMARSTSTKRARMSCCYYNILCN